MANAEHLALLKDGVGKWNPWRKANPGVIPDLSSANLQRANLYNADLCEVDLRHTHPSFATLRSAALRDANLEGAILSASDLSNAGLRGADLAGATLFATTFANTRLTGARGLESCRHEAPSTIGIDILLQSNGELPEIFLRGCGVPEQFITFARSLLVQPILFYSCFISYSTKDQEFCDRLHTDLQNRGVRCWFAPHDIRGGRKLHEQIDEAIRGHDRLLLILSENSMNSEWVKTEIANARQKELNEKRQVLFPISVVPFKTIREWKNFDADTGKDSAREIREYFIPDFSNWKDHESYNAAFERLVRDLKAESASATLST